MSAKEKDVLTTNVIESLHNFTCSVSMSSDPKISFRSVMEREERLIMSPPGDLYCCAIRVFVHLVGQW